MASFTAEQRIVLEALHVGAYLEWNRGPDHNPDIHSIEFSGLKPEDIADNTDGLTLQMVSDLIFDGLIQIDNSYYDEDGPKEHFITMTKAGHDFMNTAYVLAQP